jgi:DNA gyrase subunit A
VDKTELATRQVLVVSEKGYGKRSPVEDYRITNRGGKGVKTLQTTDKTGCLIAIKDVKEDDQLMIINRSGITIRMGLDELRVLGRATQGVRLIELRKNDQIAAVAKVDSDLKEEDGEITLDPNAPVMNPSDTAVDTPMTRDDVEDPSDMDAGTEVDNAGDEE